MLKYKQAEMFTGSKLRRIILQASCLKDLSHLLTDQYFTLALNSAAFCLLWIKTPFPRPLQ